MKMSNLLICNFISEGKIEPCFLKKKETGGFYNSDVVSLSSDNY